MTTSADDRSRVDVSRIIVAVQERRRLIRDALLLALADEPGIEVAGAVSHGCELRELLAKHRPLHVVLVGGGQEPVSRSSEGVRFITYSDCLDLATLMAIAQGQADGRGPGPGADSGRPRNNTAPTNVLTDRELEVLRHVAAGLSSREIAEVLRITLKSVQNHRQRIYAKLGVQGRAQAVAVSSQPGIIREIGNSLIGMARA